MNVQETALYYYNSCLEAFPHFPKTELKACARINAEEKMRTYDSETQSEEIAFLEQVVLEIDKM